MQLKKELPALIASAFTAATVRSIPESLSYPYLVGDDTLIYAGVIHRAHSYADLMSFFPSPLLPMLLYPLSKVVGSVAVMKIYPPIAYGALAAAFYLFARASLRMNRFQSLLSTVLAILQFGMLRISWDLHRNILGILFLLLLLILIDRPLNRRSAAATGAFATLIFLTHELTSILMFAISICLLIYAVIKREWSRIGNVLISVGISTILIVYVTASYPQLLSEIFATYVCSDMLQKASLLFTLIHLPLLPFIFLGCQKNRVQLAWLLVTIASGFSPVFSPFAIALWDRWLIMMVPQSALIAGRGASKLAASATSTLTKFVAPPHRLKFIPKVMCVTVSALLLAPSVYLASGFIAYPSHQPFWYYNNPSLWRTGWSGIPSTMLSNTLALEDCADAVKVISKLNLIVGQSDVVLAHSVFYGWLLLYLDEQKNLIPFGYGRVERAVALAKTRGLDKIYLLWFVAGSGWHEPGPELSTFQMVFRSGIIAVYLYQG